jgi:rRNA maturation RNase YbeY
LLTIDRKRLKKTVEALLIEAGFPDRDLSILFLDDRKIARLNKKCFERDWPTNVISFSYLGGFDYETLGDIAISVEKAEAEAAGAGVPFYERLIALVIHGLVHIMGYDHELGPREARRMHYREKKLIRTIKQNDDYKELVSL